MQESDLFKKRHSLAHVLLMAIKDIYPNAVPTIGPVIDTGFYYDIDFTNGEKPALEDLPKIEEKMHEILSKNLDFRMETISKEKALEIFSSNKYKTELINGFEGEVTLYHTTATVGQAGDNFFDLCEGPHVENTKEISIDSFKLDKFAGAYWKGDEKREMLTRIYGLAFNTKEELDAYINQQEEAKKRDHKILGPQLKIFTSSSLVGAGLPLLQPNGTIIRKEVEDYLWSLHKKKGYSRVWTPHLAKESLYETSGHAGHYMDDMFSVFGGSSKEKFYLKPMNCPHHMQLYADNQFSYRDMPVRYFEPATVYRDEKSGQLGGLTRVRAITQDDGHLFCTTEQIGEEIKTIVSIIKEFYTTMGMIDGYWVRLSLRGDDKTKYLGSDEVWEKAESALTKVCIEENLPYKPAKDEAAFYGPKLDFMFKDAIGREWQLATIQCDFNLPERFDLSFINNEGKKERPVVIHRAISGSLERFMGVMIEHYGGAFPLWLSPVQVAILPISDKHHDYAKDVFTKLQDKDIRVKLDDSKESLGKKIRAVREMKTPYWVVIGDKDIEAGMVTLESRDHGQIGQMKAEEVVERIEKEIKSRS